MQSTVTAFNSRRRGIANHVPLATLADETATHSRSTNSPASPKPMKSPLLGTTANDSTKPVGIYFFGFFWTLTTPIQWRSTNNEFSSSSAQQLWGRRKYTQNRVMGFLSAPQMQSRGLGVRDASFSALSVISNQRGNAQAGVCEATILAPRLIAALGTRCERYQPASEVEWDSGMRQACQDFKRQTFHEFAGQSIPLASGPKPSTRRAAQAGSTPRRSKVSSFQAESH